MNMKRIVFLACIVFVFTVITIFAEQTVVSVTDYAVSSDRADYKYIGKGIARLIAGELAKSGGVKIIDREELNKVLSEQELSLSDLSDATKRVQVGKLLSASYIVTGEVIDMGNVVIVSARMVSVETGEVIWQMEITEKLQTYDFIAATIGSAILTKLGANVESSTATKVEKKEEKNETAIVKLSEGIDAIDRGDKEIAIQDLEAARKIDPANEVAKYYLSTIATSAAKFRVETDIYAATYNPASLGFIDKDQMYAITSLSLYPPTANENGGQLVDGKIFKQYPQVSRLGYYFPVIKRLGLAFEYIFGYADMSIDNKPITFKLGGVDVTDMHPDYNMHGGSLLAGYKITDNFGVGLACMAAYVLPGTGQNNYVTNGFFWGLDGGFLANFFDDNLTIDAHAVYAAKKEAVLDTVNAVAYQGNVPLIIDNSVNLSLFDKSLTLALKGIANVYIDKRGGYELRLIPIVQYSIGQVLALRAGYEYSHLDQAGRFTMGQGFLGGITLKLWNFELSGNYTLRQTPATMLPGYLVSGSTLVLSLSYSGLFFQ